MIMGLGAVVLMVFTSPKLSGLVIAAIPLIVLPLVAFGRSVRRKSRQAQDTLADATAYASEQIGAVRTLQAFTNERLVTGRSRSAVEDAFEAARSSILARAVLTFVAIFAIFASVVAVLWFGSRDVLSGVMSPGTLSQFLIYAVIAAGALGALSEVWGDSARPPVLRSASPSFSRKSRRSRRRPIQSRCRSARRVGRVRRCQFAYPARPDRPRSTASLRREAGRDGGDRRSVRRRQEHDLLADPALLRSVSGHVAVDGVDLREADPKEVRGRIAIVPQDATMFAASARDNIGFGRPGASEAEIEAAARAAHADEFIRTLAEGYDTELGERGVMLSGGQRQRIAIARAILRDAPILLLDEATSALDAESETLVQKALEGLMQGRTTLVIAHRLATVLKADRILVMDQGRIVEEGTHQSLVRHNGIYARLAKLQFETGASAFRGGGARVSMYTVYERSHRKMGQ